MGAIRGEVRTDNKFVRERHLLAQDAVHGLSDVALVVVRDHYNTHFWHHGPSVHCSTRQCWGCSNSIGNEGCSLTTRACQSSGWVPLHTLLLPMDKIARFQGFTSTPVADEFKLDLSTPDKP